jgi:hypothetical protein
MQRLKRVGQFAARGRARPQVMQAARSHSRRRAGAGREGRADRVLRSARAVAGAQRSLTADYLTGRNKVTRRPTELRRARVPRCTSAARASTT